MTLETLQKARIEAMRAKENLRRDTIAGLIGAVQKYGIDNMCRDNIPEDAVNQILLKEQKTMLEMINTCPENRQDLKNEYLQKMEIITEFSPQLVTDPAKIEEMILGAITVEPTKANKGVIMKTVMPILKGKVDMKTANEVIGKLLK